MKFFDVLKNDGFYFCGTLKENRGRPKQLKTQIKKFKKGDSILLNKKVINFVGFKDNGSIQPISTFHSNSETAPFQSSSGKYQIHENLKSLNAIKDYNKFMGGADLLDQMTKYYSIDRKSQKWTTKITFHLLNIAFYNSYILYKKIHLQQKPI